MASESPRSSWKAVLLLFFALLRLIFATDSTTGIPPLIRGHAVPVVSLGDIMTCPYIQPTIRAPDDDDSTEVYFSMTIDRLLGIDDIDQTISISASIYMQWGVYGCSDSYTASKVDEEERVFVIDPGSVWYPTVIFANSSNDIYMEATQYKSDMQVLYVPTIGNRTLFFHWTRVGVLSAKCNLNLRKFPFDSQTCDFMFVMKEPNGFLKFANGVSLKEPTMSANEQWRLIGSTTTTGTAPSASIRNGLSSYVSFQISFGRNPYYHIYNLLAPCYVLIALVFASFLMPPEKPDRPVICCTILLAFIVAQSDVLKEVPHTSESILLAEYILLFTGLTAVVTTHDMIMCELSKDTKYDSSVDMNLCSRTFNIRVVRGLDVAAFLMSLGMLLIINVYAVSVVLD